MEWSAAPREPKDVVIINSGYTTASVCPNIRLLIHQPGLPRYRIPVFRELAQRPGIHLKVLYGPGTGPSDQIDNAQAQGFEADAVGRRILKVGRRELWWSNAQWKCAGSDGHDVLILPWNVHYASLVPALLRARRHGTPTILWGHGYSKRERAWRRRIRNKVADLATALLFYNQGVADRFIEAGWEPSRIFVALNALDQTTIGKARAAWLDDPRRLLAFRAEHDLGEGPVLLFVSRLEAANRADLMLQAVARLSGDYPAIKAVIIGRGSDESRLRGMANQLGITANVRFTGPIYDEMEIAPWFLCSDVFCYPANIGLSLLHAFGYGLPVVTSDAVESQNPEIEAIEHGANGLLYRRGDVDSLIDTLAKLISDKPLQERLSEAALRTVNQKFNLKNMVDGMEAAVRYCAGLNLRSNPR